MVETMEMLVAGAKEGVRNIYVCFRFGMRSLRSSFYFGFLFALCDAASAAAETVSVCIAEYIIIRNA